jgi:hypothetical protein
MAEYLQLTPGQLAEQCEQYAKELRKVKGDLTMAQHIALRALMGQVNEPSPGLFALILDRTEGKVKDQLEVSGDADKALRIEVVYANRDIRAPSAAPGAGDDQG